MAETVVIERNVERTSISQQAWSLECVQSPCDLCRFFSLRHSRRSFRRPGPRYPRAVRTGPWPAFEVKEATVSKPASPSVAAPLEASGERVSPLSAWGRRWKSAAALTVAGAALGAAVGFTVAPTYTAEARVAVGAGALSAGASAGFPQASSQIAASYARYVNDLGLENGVSVVASPIPDSSIIRIEALSPSSSGAIDVANETVDRLTSEVNAQSEGDALLERYQEAAGRWAQAQGRLDEAQAGLDTLEANGNGTGARAQELRAETTRLSSRVASLLLVRDGVGEEYRLRNEAVNSVGLRTVAEASAADSDRVALVQRYAAIGLVLGGALSLVLAVYLERRRRDAQGARTRVTSGS